MANFLANLFRKKVAPAVESTWTETDAHRLDVMLNKLFDANFQMEQTFVLVARHILNIELKGRPLREGYPHKERIIRSLAHDIDIWAKGNGATINNHMLFGELVYFKELAGAAKNEEDQRFFSQVHAIIKALCCAMVYPQSLYYTIVRIKRNADAKYRKTIDIHRDKHDIGFAQVGPSLNLSLNYLNSVENNVYWQHDNKAKATYEKAKGELVQCYTLHQEFLSLNKLKWEDVSMEIKAMAEADYERFKNATL